MTLRNKILLSVVLSQTAFAGFTVNAASLEAAQKIESNTNRASAQSQQSINNSAEKTLSYKADIEQLQEQVKNLEVYRNHLAALVDNQKQEVTSIDQQIEEIKQTRQGVVPLMYQMIDGLKQIVANDKPIRLKQREQRIEKLDNMMAVANISDAEKYRRILEAYQIEMDYGIKLGLYQDQISLNDQQQIEVDVVYLGRVSLIARSLSGKQYWSWDVASKEWQAIDNPNTSELDKAYAMASKQAAPSLIILPVSLTIAQQ